MCLFVDIYVYIFFFLTFHFSGLRYFLFSVLGSFLSIFFLCVCDFICLHLSSIYVFLIDVSFVDFHVYFSLFFPFFILIIFLYFVIFIFSFIFIFIHLFFCVCVISFVDIYHIFTLIEIHF